MNAPVFAPPSLQRRADNKRFAELEADLMPTLVALRLDHTRSTYVGAKGDLVAFLSDIDVGARKREPALLLACKTNPSERQVYVPMGSLWLLLDPDVSGDPRTTRQNRQNQRAALNALTEKLYGFVTKDDTFRVLDALFDFAQDLIHAKPPTWMTHAQWLQALAEDDMTLFHNGVAQNR